MNVDQLIQRAVDGDTDAGPMLVSVFGRQLIEYLRRAAPHLSETDLEIVAERSVENAVSMIYKFDPKLGSFDAWLRGFARLGVLEYGRQNPATSSLSEYRDVPLVVASQREKPAALEDIRLEQLQRAIQTLRPTDQLIIALRDVNGLSYEAIAQRLGSTAITCRQRHYRAISRLREAFHATGESAEMHVGTHRTDAVDAANLAPPSNEGTES